MADQSSGSSGEGMVFVIGTLFVLFIVLWTYFPAVFVYPVFYLKYAMTAVMAPFSSDMNDLLGYLGKVDPGTLDKNNAFKFFNSSRWDAIYVLVGATLMWIGLKSNKKYEESRNNMTPQKQITLMADDPKFPHLIPFVDVNPLDFSAKEGQMRMPDLMVKFGVRNRIIQKCPGCGNPVYYWEDEDNYSCESRKIMINLGVGSVEDYCRHDFHEPPAIKGFNDARCRKLFINELNHLGKNPKDINKVAMHFARKNIWALGCLAMFVAKMTSPTNKELGESSDVLKFVKLMAEVSQGVIESGKDKGKGIVDKGALKRLRVESLAYLTPDKMAHIKDIFNKHDYGTTFIMGVLARARYEKGVLSTAL